MKATLTQRAKTEILIAIDAALESNKVYQVEIKLRDNSLRARQRALANIWYVESDDHFGYESGYTEAYCKYRWGLSLISQDDPDTVMMICRMLDDIDTWEEKVELIRCKSIWFPIMRDKGGLDAKKQAKYLRSFQRHAAEYGLILTSPREKDLLNCAQAQR